MDDGCSSNAVAERAAIDDGRSLRFSSLDDTPISSILSRGGGEFLHLPLLLSLRLPLPLLLLSRPAVDGVTAPGRLTLLPATLPLLLLLGARALTALTAFLPIFLPAFLPILLLPATAAAAAGGSGLRGGRLRRLLPEKGTRAGQRHHPGACPAP